MLPARTARRQRLAGRAAQTAGARSQAARRVLEMKEYRGRHAESTAWAVYARCARACCAGSAAASAGGGRAGPHSGKSSRCPGVREEKLGGEKMTSVVGVPSTPRPKSSRGRGGGGGGGPGVRWYHQVAVADGRRPWAGRSSRGCKLRSTARWRRRKRVERGRPRRAARVRLRAARPPAGASGRAAGRQAGSNRRASSGDRTAAEQPSASIMRR